MLIRTHTYTHIYTHAYTDIKVPTIAVHCQGRLSPHLYFSTFYLPSRRDAFGIFSIQFECTKEENRA